jgi:hypothetical protein
VVKSWAEGFGFSPSSQNTINIINISSKFAIHVGIALIKYPIDTICSKQNYHNILIILAYVLCLQVSMN